MAASLTQSVGRCTESIARRHLESHGLKHVASNFHCRFGELDLVMLDRECLVFIEVRYRRPNRFACASATVDGRKQHKLIQTAEFFLARHRRYRNSAVRFDVVGIDGPNTSQYEIQWLEDAFRPGEE